MGLDRSGRFRGEFGEGTAEVADRNLAVVEDSDVREQGREDWRDPRPWLLPAQYSHLS
jgi:hypothetical protein